MLHYLSVQTTTEGFSVWGAPSDTKYIQTQAYDPSGKNNAKRVTAAIRGHEVRPTGHFIEPS